MNILRRLNSGGVLLTTLVIFFLFMVMMIAAVNYINRQYKAATNQEEQQRAFRIGEAGIDYTLFLLRENVETMASLKGKTEPVTKVMTDPITHADIGTISLTFADASTTERIAIVSKGISVSGQGCERVIATVEHDQSAYNLIYWQHKLGC